VFACFVLTVSGFAGGGTAVDLFFLFLSDLLKCVFFINALVIHFIYCIFNAIVFLLFLFVVRALKIFLFFYDEIM